MVGIVTLTAHIANIARIVKAAKYSIAFGNTVGGGSDKMINSHFSPLRESRFLRE